MKKVVLFIIFLWIITLNNIALGADDSGDYSSLFDTTDPYLLVPMSEEALKRISDLKKSFGEAENISEAEKNLASHLISLKQTFVINNDGSVDLKEKGTFHIVKKAGDDSLLFTRNFPEFRRDNENRRVPLYYLNAKVDIDFPHKRYVNNEKTKIVFNSEIKKFTKDTVITGNYEVNAKIINLVNAFDSYNRIDFNVRANEVSIPIDSITTSVTFADNTVKIYSFDAFVMTGEQKRSEDVTSKDGKIDFSSSRRLLEGQIYTARLDFNDTVSSKVRENINKKSLLKVSGIIKPFDDSSPDKDNKAIKKTPKGKWSTNKTMLFSSATLFLLTLFYYLPIWWFFVKNGDSPLYLRPLLKTPYNISVAKAAAIYFKENFRSESIVPLSLISLAAKGFLKISYYKKDKEVTFGRTDKNIENCTEKEEIILLEGLFKTEKDITLKKNIVFAEKFKKCIRKYREYLSSYQTKMLSSDRTKAVFGFFYCFLLP